MDVYYLEPCSELDEGPFMKEERHLIDGIARSLGEAIDHKYAEKELRRIEWLLTKSFATNRVNTASQDSQDQPCQDLTELNTTRLILDSVGKDLLAEVSADFLSLLEQCE